LSGARIPSFSLIFTDTGQAQAAARPRNNFVDAGTLLLAEYLGGQEVDRAPTMHLIADFEMSKSLKAVDTLNYQSPGGVNAAGNSAGTDLGCGSLVG
jgi:hypothetical protein